MMLWCMLLGEFVCVWVWWLRILGLFAVGGFGFRGLGLASFDCLSFCVLCLWVLGLGFGLDFV